MPLSIAGRENKTILVVDDEDAARALICTVLRQGGYSVLEAEDSETATMVVGCHMGEIDLLLTDVSLPGRNGCELAASLHKSEPGLPVLFVSGLPGSEFHALQEIPKERYRFLQKPFGISDLLARVRQSLESAETTTV